MITRAIVRAFAPISAKHGTSIAIVSLIVPSFRFFRKESLHAISPCSGWLCALAIGKHPLRSTRSAADAADPAPATATCNAAADCPTPGSDQHTRVLEAGLSTGRRQPKPE